ncbi:hypothetical protein BH10ACI2_BH10ACI2_07240 [soil metagenome]
MARKSVSVALRGLVVWLVFIFAESINGTIREIFVKPILGDLRARQLSFLSAIVIIFAVASIFFRWIGETKRKHLLLVGLLWVSLTFGFEVFVGRMLLGISWEIILSDYNIFNGGLMTFGLIILAVTPILVSEFYRIYIPQRSSGISVD